MADHVVEPLIQKGEAIVNSWLSATEALSQRHGAPPRMQDTPGPLVLALNLSHLPLKSTLEELRGASEDSLKNHKGVRTTLAVVKVLSPGFSSVSAEADGGTGPAKGGNKGKRAGAAEVKEKLCSVAGEDLHMHSYELVNKKGTYQRGGRTTGFARVSPGMVFSLNVWGNKVVQTFKGQEEDVLPFTFVVVQLGMKSIGSSAAGSGHMLELRGMQSVRSLSLASARLLQYDSFPHSLQGAAAALEKNGTTSEADKEAGTNEDQALIKSNLASSVQLLAVKPAPCNGVFAVGPEGKMNFHISGEPLADLPANAVHVRFDPDTLGVSPGHEEWVAKFLNIASMIGAVQVFVVLDSYKAKDVAPADLVLEGFVRIDVPTVIRHVLSAKATVVEPDASESFLTQSMPASSLKHVVLYQGLIAGLDLALDIRFMTKKAGAAVDESASGEPTSTMVHHDARWERAHFVHFFLQREPVLTVMLPSLASVGSAVERAKRALQPVSLVHTIEGACFEEEEEEPAPAPAPPPAKKAKAAKAAPA